MSFSRNLNFFARVIKGAIISNKEVSREEVSRVLEDARKTHDECVKLHDETMRQLELSDQLLKSNR